MICLKVDPLNLYHNKELRSALRERIKKQNNAIHDFPSDLQDIANLANAETVAFIKSILERKDYITLDSRMRGIISFKNPVNSKYLRKFFKQNKYEPYAQSLDRILYKRSCILKRNELKGKLKNSLNKTTHYTNVFKCIESDKRPDKFYFEAAAFFKEIL